MKLIPLCKSALLASLFPIAAWAQPTTTTATTDAPASSYNVGSDFGTVAGTWEFTLGGNGGSNKDIDSTFGGVGASVGYYFNETLELVVRQSLNYSNPAGGGTSWNGATRVAIDQHFTPFWTLRPFVGVSFGGVYGDNVADSWAAGLEAGVKHYVLPRTFVFASVEYNWLFSDADDADDSFDDGQYLWTVGVGFNL